MSLLALLAHHVPSKMKARLYTAALSPPKWFFWGDSVCSHTQISSTGTKYSHAKLVNINCGVHQPSQGILIPTKIIRTAEGAWRAGEILTRGCCSQTSGLLRQHRLGCSGGAGNVEQSQHGTAGIHNHGDGVRELLCRQYQQQKNRLCVSQPDSVDDAIGAEID